MIIKPMRLLGIGALLRLAISGIKTFIKAIYSLIKYLRMRVVVLYFAAFGILTACGVLKKGSSLRSTAAILGGVVFIASLAVFAKSLSEEEKGKRPKKRDRHAKNEPSTAEAQTAAQAAAAPVTPVITVQPAAGQAPQAYVLTPATAAGTQAPVYSPMDGAAFEEKAAAPAQKEIPRYFRVAQNPHYVMAEYSDRVVLFYETKEGLKYVRTDNKEGR